MESNGRQRVQSRLGRIALWIRPDGLQARARRNAWSAMVVDRQHRMERLAADAVVRAAPARNLRARA